MDERLGEDLVVFHLRGRLLEFYVENLRKIEYYKAHEMNTKAIFSYQLVESKFVSSIFIISRS